MGRDSVRSAQLGVSSIIKDKYVACRKLGEGGCGVIYEVARITAPQKRYACKAELVGESRNDEILRLEARVIKGLNEAKARHSGKCIEEGTLHNFNYMIMTLFGPSLLELMKRTPDKVRKFSEFTCIAVGLQALDGLKELHDIGYIHRDVKPSNFAVGELGTSKERLIYILDFGLARSYQRIVDGKKVLRDPRRVAPFRGTARYCSINAHAREEQGRHDDLWSLMYMIIEMYLGELPWRHLERDKTETCKVESEKELIAQCPREIELAIGHIRGLSYSSTPSLFFQDYALIRGCFCQWYLKRCKGETTLDWEESGRLPHFRSTVQLPSVYEKDMSELSILELLQIPKEMDEIKDMPGSGEKVALTTNSSHDDTIEDSKDAPTAPAKPVIGKYGAKKTASTEQVYQYKGAAKSKEASAKSGSKNPAAKQYRSKEQLAK